MTWLHPSQEWRLQNQVRYKTVILCAPIQASSQEKDNLDQLTFESTAQELDRCSITNTNMISQKTLEAAVRMMQWVSKLRRFSLLFFFFVFFFFMSLFD